MHLEQIVIDKFDLDRTCIIYALDLVRTDEGDTWLPPGTGERNRAATHQNFHIDLGTAVARPDGIFRGLMADARRPDVRP